MAEDEPSLGQIIKESLETRNFEVVLCANGDLAYKAYKEEKPLLLVLDVMMPKIDGFSLATKIRNEDSAIPIIFLTAKSQTADVVEGFTIGGNDYLKKPFSMEELIVRINALLRRKKDEEIIGELAIGKFIFDLSKQTLTTGKKIQALTHREAHLLYHLIKNKEELYRT